ncbi:hypothetical protein RPMA_19875 [Tardiphaga alba]|uniref:Immunity protein 26 of polymorphic toxin system n=1 Tax=Tardiphaga alba TaxID=340268 RepID=A0ABX8AAP4_9BRAD|nr:hypothetical protein [Tardiphaga alba]QUS40844.1 hypothetical protein RPMA_19875 [Tardiphaga alba]
MTQPTIIYFGPDGRNNRRGSAPPKVFLRALLFATSKRGRIIESMHVRLARNEARQNFNIWVYGDERMVRGSGLFVGESGVAVNHHFLLPRDDKSFQFLAGKYRLEVFARLLGDREQTCLWSQELEVSEEAARRLLESASGLYFDWGPDAARYMPHIDEQPERTENPWNGLNLPQRMEK